MASASSEKSLKKTTVRLRGSLLRKVVTAAKIEDVSLNKFFVKHAVQAAAAIIEKRDLAQKIKPEVAEG